MSAHDDIESIAQLFDHEGRHTQAVKLRAALATLCAPVAGEEAEPMVSYHTACNVAGDAYRAGTKGIGYTAQLVALNDAITYTHAAAVERVAWHIGKAVEYIENQYPDAKVLDRGPIMRNLKNWHRQLTEALTTHPQAAPPKGVSHE